MGQSSDELRQEIDQHREDAADKIDQLQTQFQGTADDLRNQAEETVGQVREQVMGTVDDTIETVKENIHFEEQIQERPLVALGAALIGGFVLGGMIGGGGNGQQHPDHSGAASAQASGGGMGSAIRHAFKSTGLEETFSNAAAGMMGSLTEQVKQTIDRNVPGFSQKMDTAKNTSGSVMDKTRKTQP